MKNSTRILVLAAPFGTGHLMVARAIAAAIERIYLETYDIEVADMLSGVRLLVPLDKLSALVYRWSISSFHSYPLGMILKFLNRHSRGANEFFTRFFEKQAVAWLRAKNPDVVISTFSVVSFVAAKLLKKHWERHIPVISVITDCGHVHRLWITDCVDALVVSTPDTADYVVEQGAPSSIVHCLGLPISDAFRKLPTTSESRRTLQLDDRPTILMTGGGMGLSNNMFKLAQRLLATLPHVQYILVTGKNRRLLRRLRAIASQEDAIVYGFTSEMPTLLAAADFVVGKAGWVSLTEAMASERPTIVIDVLPVLEEGNAEYIERNAVGAVVTDLESAMEKVATFVNEPGLLEVYKHSLAKLGLDRDADEAIVRFVVETLWRGAKARSDKL